MVKNANIKTRETGIEMPYFLYSAIALKMWRLENDAVYLRIIMFLSYIMVKGSFRCNVSVLANDLENFQN